MDSSLNSGRVVKTLEALMEEHGTPEEIISDNGTEFTSNTVLKWCHERGQKWETSNQDNGIKMGMPKALMGS